MRRFAWNCARQAVSWTTTCQRTRSLRKPVSGLIAMTAFAQNQRPSTIQPMRIPDPQALCSHSLIRAGTVEVVNTACSVITQTMCTLTDTQEDYIDALDRLVKLLELSQKALGNQHKEDTIWDVILEVRAQVQESKERTEELQYVLSCTLRALEAAGEAAHVAGADYAGHTASDRLNSATSQQATLNSRLDEAKTLLQTTELTTIQVSIEYEKKQRDKKLKEQVELRQGEEEEDKEVTEETATDPPTDATSHIETSNTDS